MYVRCSSAEGHVEVYSLLKSYLEEIGSKHVSFVIIPGLNKMVCVIRNQDGDNEVVGKPVCECSNGKVANLNK